MSYALQQPSSSYRVEVSGWDSTQSFFLEKATLYWDTAGQQISLRARLREGVVIFVRLLQSSESDENFPIPYVVSKNLPIEIDSRVTVSITRMHPTPSYKQSVATLEFRPLLAVSKVNEAIKTVGRCLSSGPLILPVASHPSERRLFRQRTKQSTNGEKYSEDA